MLEKTNFRPEEPIISTDEDGWGVLSPERVKILCLANAPRSSLSRQAFFRKIYLAFFVLFTLLILLPAWAIVYTPRRNRPRQGWTLKRCLRVRLKRRLCGLVARCEIDYLGRDLSKDVDPLLLEGAHAVTIPPAPASWLRGHPADTLEQLHRSRGAWNPHFIHRHARDVAGVWGKWNDMTKKDQIYGFEEVEAFWYTGEKKQTEHGARIHTERRPRRLGDPVMLAFHGGGYLCGTASPECLTSSIYKMLVKDSPIAHILSVDYRLAPQAPWPLPLLDAISAYHYLVHIEAVPEGNIVVGGDSAGGHLAMALVRWLRDEGAHLGLRGPRCMVLMSPWSDLGFTNVWGKEAYSHNADSDTIDDTFGPFASALLLRALPLSIAFNSPYISPASLLLSAEGSFQDFPPTCVVYGGAERLAKSIEILWSRIQAARPSPQVGIGLDKLLVSPDAVHDFMIFPWMAKESASIYEELNCWLRELLSSDTKGSEGLSLVSPREARAPDWKPIVSQRRMSRRPKRESIKLHSKSPVMGAVMNAHGVMRMVEDMREEGMRMMDIPNFELDTENIGKASKSL